MDDATKILIAYVVVIHVVTFLTFWADKDFSKRRMWRIPEKSLLCLSALGGSLGALAAMKLFRHKTKHRRFRRGVPLMFLAHVLLILAFFGVKIYLMMQL